MTLMLTAVVIATAVFPWTVLGQESDVLTVTSGEDVCHLETVDGNPNCVTDGEGQTVRSRPSCGILDRRAGSPLTLGTVCVLRAHHRYFASMRSRFAALPALRADRR